MRWRWYLVGLLLLLALGLGWWTLVFQTSATNELAGEDCAGAQVSVGAASAPSDSPPVLAGRVLNRSLAGLGGPDAEDAPTVTSANPEAQDVKQPSGAAPAGAEGGQEASSPGPTDEPLAPPEEAEDEPLAVDGKVVDRNGASVQGAAVKALLGAGQTLGPQVTDEAGRFSFEADAEGQVTFEASKEELRGRAGPFILGDRGLGSVLIVLGADGALAGKVLLREDRSPVAGARLLVTDRNRNLDLLAVSGADGTFRVELGTPAEIQIRLKDNLDLVDTDTTMELSLAAGESRTDLLLLVRQGMQLEGTVSREGKPVEGSTVVLEDLSCYFNSKTWETSSDAAGNFSFRGARPGGRFVAKAVHPDLGFGESAIVATHPGGAAGRLDVKLTPGQTLEGRLVTDDGRGVAGLKVNLGRMDVRLPMPGTMTQSGPDGSFQVKSVPPGEYQFAVETAKDARLLSQNFSVDDAGPTEPMAINLGPGAEGYITGRVTDEAGQPLPGARVNAWARSPEVVSSARTDPEGNFRLEGLGPGGNFRVFASATGYTDSSVDGQEPGAEGVNLVLLPAALLRGRVLDEATGAPLAEFHLKGRPVDMDVASPDGSFAIRLEEGSVLYFSARGYLNQEAATRDPSSGQPLDDLVVRMRKGFPISGRVLCQHSGAALKGARVQVLTEGDLAVNFLVWDVKWHPEDPFTDQEGRFQISGPPPGQPYSLVAYHPDYAPGLINGTTERQVELALNRGGTVTVTVRQGGVLLDAGASFFGTFQPNGGLVEFLIGYTLFKGQWRFEKVPVGTYSMKAHGFDGTKSEAPAVFEVREGDDLALELQLPAAPADNTDKEQ
jgi:protocatechuate 3,4-dioxygenase beta subunit